MGDTENVEEWSVGETATVTIDHYSDLENAIVTDNNRDLAVNLGPLTCPPGTEVTAERVEKAYAICYDREYWTDDYKQTITRYSKKLFANPSITDWPIGETRTAKITSIRNNNNRSIVYGDGTQLNIGNADVPIETPVPVARLSGNIGIALNPEHWPSDYFDRVADLMHPDNGELSYEINRDEGTITFDYRRETYTFELIEREPPIETTDDSATPSSDTTSTNTASTAKEPSNSSPGSEKLREQAEEQATQNPPVSVEKTRTQEYSRSEKVKQYAKKRADGTCEGCGDPAPFTSATGDPYLHAHHVHELSDGGADTPETVIALCPNCHYRVHHGEDGDAYNQDLIEELAAKENVPVETITSDN